MEAWSHFVDCFSSRDVENETQELTSSLASQAEWKRLAFGSFWRKEQRHLLPSRGAFSA